MNWRPSSTVRWLAWMLGYGLLSWAGWVGSYQLIDRLEDAAAQWNIWFGCLIFPLLLAFLGGVWLRAPWWISTAPFVILLSMLGVSAYIVLTPPERGPDYLEARVVLAVGIVVVYPLVTLNFAKVGVRLGWLLADENHGGATRWLQLALVGLVLTVLGLIMDEGLFVIIGLGALFVGGVFAGLWRTWWPGP
jgi:hypothetical protein